MKKIKICLFIFGTIFTFLPFASVQAKEYTNSSVERISSSQFEKIGYCNTGGVNFRSSKNMSIIIGVMGNRHTLYINPKETKSYNNETYVHCYSPTYSTDGYVCSRYVTISGNMN